MDKQTTKETGALIGMSSSKSQTHSSSLRRSATVRRGMHLGHQQATTDQKTLGGKAKKVECPTIPTEATTQKVTAEVHETDDLSQGSTSSANSSYDNITKIDQKDKKRGSYSLVQSTDTSSDKMPEVPKVQSMEDMRMPKEDADQIAQLAAHIATPQSSLLTLVTAMDDQKESKYKLNEDQVTQLAQVAIIQSLFEELEEAGQKQEPKTTEWEKAAPIRKQGLIEKLSPLARRVRNAMLGFGSGDIRSVDVETVNKLTEEMTEEVIRNIITELTGRSKDDVSIVDIEEVAFLLHRAKIREGCPKIAIMKENDPMQILLGEEKKYTDTVTDNIKKLHDRYLQSRHADQMTERWEMARSTEIHKELDYISASVSLDKESKITQSLVEKLTDEARIHNDSMTELMESKPVTSHNHLRNRRQAKSMKMTEMEMTATVQQHTREEKIQQSLQNLAKTLEERSQSETKHLSAIFSLFLIEHSKIMMDSLKPKPAELERKTPQKQQPLQRFLKALKHQSNPNTENPAALVEKTAEWRFAERNAIIAIRTVNLARQVIQDNIEGNRSMLRKGINILTDFIPSSLIGLGSAAALIVGMYNRVSTGEMDDPLAISTGQGTSAACVTLLLSGMAGTGLKEQTAPKESLALEIAVNDTFEHNPAMRALKKACLKRAYNKQTKTLNILSYITWVTMFVWRGGINAVFQMPNAIPLTFQPTAFGVFKFGSIGQPFMSLGEIVASTEASRILTSLLSEAAAIHGLDIEDIGEEKLNMILEELKSTLEVLNKVSMDEKWTPEQINIAIGVLFDEIVLENIDVIKNAAIPNPSLKTTLGKVLTSATAIITIVGQATMAYMGYKNFEFCTMDAGNARLAASFSRVNPDGTLSLVPKAATNGLWQAATESTDQIMQTSLAPQIARNTTTTLESIITSAAHNTTQPTSAMLQSVANLERAATANATNLASISSPLTEAQKATSEVSRKTRGIPGATRLSQVEQTVPALHPVSNATSSLHTTDLALKTTTIPSPNATTTSHPNGTMIESIDFATTNHGNTAITTLTNRLQQNGTTTTLLAANISDRVTTFTTAFDGPLRKATDSIMPEMTSLLSEITADKTITLPTDLCANPDLNIFERVHGASRYSTLGLQISIASTLFRMCGLVGVCLSDLQNRGGFLFANLLRMGITLLVDPLLEAFGTTPGVMDALNFADIQATVICALLCANIKCTTDTKIPKAIVKQLSQLKDRNKERPEMQRLIGLVLTEGCRANQDPAQFLTQVQDQVEAALREQATIITMSGQTASTAESAVGELEAHDSPSTSREQATRISMSGQTAPTAESAVVELGAYNRPSTSRTTNLLPTQDANFAAVNSKDAESANLEAMQSRPLLETQGQYALTPKGRIVLQQAISAGRKGGQTWASSVYGALKSRMTRSGARVTNQSTAGTLVI